MKKDINIRKFIHTTIREYLNEAYIDQEGNLKDMNYDPSSDDLWDDKKFLSFVNKNIEDGSEMPEKFYKELSDNHKKLYRKEILDYGGQIIAHSENDLLIKDLILNNIHSFEMETKYSLN